MSRARLLVWLVVAVLLPAFTRRALHVHAAAPAPTRHSIKINPGPTEATATPTLPSHTFSMPLPTAPPASTPQSQARAINAAEMSQRARRPPANFSLPPPLLADWQSDGGNVPGSEMYEEALWRRWDGDCMHLRQDSYHYTLCPFHNITQRGLQLTSLNVLLGSARTHNTDSLRLEPASSSLHQPLTPFSLRYAVFSSVVAVCGRAGGRRRAASWR